MAVCPHKGLDLPTTHLVQLIISKMVYYNHTSSSEFNGPNYNNFVLIRTVIHLMYNNVIR